MLPQPMLVLLIEDCSDDALLAHRALLRAAPDTHVLTCSDGLEAVLHLESALRSDLPDLVLLDIDLPTRNGLALLQWIRSKSEFKCIPVVMFSGSQDPRHRSEAYAWGANSFVRKPALGSEFGTAVETIGAYWSTLHARPAGAGGGAALPSR